LGEEEAVELITKAAIEAGVEPLEARNAALRGVKAGLREMSVAARFTICQTKNPGADGAAAEHTGRPRTGSDGGSLSAVLGLPK
jgi:hypothetical protein